MLIHYEIDIKMVIQSIVFVLLEFFLDRLVRWSFIDEVG